MRIGIDCRLPYYSQGGIGQYIIQLCRALADIDDQNEYVLFHSRKDRRTYVPPSSRNFQRENLTTPSHHPLEKWTLGLEISRFRLDVLHSPDFIPPAFGAKSRVITVHDLNFYYYPEFLTKDSLRYYKGQISWAVRSANRIAVDSMATRSDVIDLLNVHPEKVANVPLAASSAFRPDWTRTQIKPTLAHFGLDRGFIIFVGTLSPRKNVPSLIKAYQKLRESSAYDEPLVIVGNKGWLYDQIFKAIRQNNLEGKVRHLEKVSETQLSHLYAAAGVMALPSFYEGFGLPILEAMRCGCPVIASNTSSLPEVAGDAAILLQPEDVDGWATSLQHVLFDEDVRKSLIARGIKQASRFNWERTARAMLSLYEEAYFHSRNDS